MVKNSLRRPPFNDLIVGVLMADND